MAQSETDTFLSSAPDWVEITSVGAQEVQLTASPRGPSGQPGPAYFLRVTLSPLLQTFEDKDAEQGAVLPAFCPERHINPGGGSFCLGLDILTARTASRFWTALRSFLLCQTYARRHGVWPPGRWLSHGTIAAQAQLRAEAAASRAGLSERYRRALEFKVGRLAGPLLAPSPKSKRSGKATARRLAIEELIEAEISRRNAENDFARDMIDWGYVCCGTMKTCSLGDRPRRTLLAEEEHS